jgi:hypothetical protein
MRVAYAGACCRVLRTSDSTQTDIGFSGNFIDVSALLSFVGAGNGLVTIWYDQTGNAYDIPNGASAPIIVTSGVYDDKIIFTGPRWLQHGDNAARDVFRNADAASIFTTVESVSTTTVQNILWASTTTVNTSRVDFRLTALNRVQVGARRLDGAGAVLVIVGDTDHNNDELILSSHINWAVGEAELYQNGVQTGSATFASTGLTSNTRSISLQIGRQSTTTNYLNGYMKNMVVYKSDQRANRAGIEAILNSYR